MIIFAVIVKILNIKTLNKTIFMTAVFRPQLSIT